MIDKIQAPEWLDSLFQLFGMATPGWLAPLLTLACVLLPLPFLVLFVVRARPRQAQVPPYRERVLLLGASSGVGRELALQYASRGCKSLVLVGRRADELEKVRLECEEAYKKGEEWEMSNEAPGWEKRKHVKIQAVAADCSKPADVERIRDTLIETLGGVDTVHLLFGLSALRPILGMAGVDPIKKTPPSHAKAGAKHAGDHADAAGLEAVLTSAKRICDVNVAASAMCATAFLPLLQLSSNAPAFVTLNSVASVIPAPTRALYGCSKAAQLLLLQGLALESDSQAKADPRRSKVRFLHVLPATIKTDFRGSAVDGDPAASGAADSSWDSNGKSDALMPEEVASAAILATDKYQQGEMLMPFKYRHARAAMVLVPSLLARLAHKKYQY